MARMVADQNLLRVHSLLVRVTHWINVLAILMMVTSGWRIYNASPIFNFRFPAGITLGGWLAGALQWHFAAMWLLALNGLVYLLGGFVSGHFRRDLLPVTRAALADDLKDALTFHLRHQVGVYNSLQRVAYLGVVADLCVLVLSGLAIWKPVQFQEIAWLLGGYEGARIVHFVAMSLLVAFVAMHVLMVLLVPRTLLAIITGRARVPPAPVPGSPLQPRNLPAPPPTESGDAL